MKTFTVWTLDVLGNPREGFDVNDRCKVGTIELPDDPTDKQIIRAMVDQGYISSTRFRFDIEREETNINIDHKPTGMPLFQLERND